MTHIKKVTLFPEKYPTREEYPFNQTIFHETRTILFQDPVTFFVGENGTGKSTLLQALAHKCGIHIWRDTDKTRMDANPYREMLYQYVDVEWTDGYVHGSFFSSDLFRHFAQNLEEWATTDKLMLDYFGGKSLMSQSHGQSLMSYFKARYRLKGLYLLDEPETALSPKSQLELLGLLKEMGRAGHAQFIVATHSPILMACPDAKIFSFDHIPVKKIDYRETDHYRIYHQFMADPDKYL